MLEKDNNIFTKCQDDLETQGYCLVKMKLPEAVKKLASSQNWSELDAETFKLTAKDGLIFQTLHIFRDFQSIEFIISLRDANNEWEEDGIWHDDGSRLLAFSLSLTLNSPKGGVLEIRKKGESNSNKIPTPDYGQMIVFKTGVEGYEHKINQVTEGQRLIIAGWCS